MSNSFRDRYPGPWQVREIPGGYKVDCGPTSLCYIYVYQQGWQSVATTGQHKLSWAEGEALAKAISALGGQDRAQPPKSARWRRSLKRTPNGRTVLRRAPVRK